MAFLKAKNNAPTIGGGSRTGYNGNPLLKKTNTTIDWDGDRLIEFQKCAADPAYFAEKYIKIVHVDHGFIPIRLYDYQKDIINKFQNNRRTTVVTSRQAGKTTTAVCLILHYILFNQHKTVALLANKGDASAEILDRLKIAYEALPEWLQQGVVTWNKRSIEIENGCKVIAAATSSSAIRGKSISVLYIDEVAFVEGWDAFSQAVLPTITSGEETKILFTSTPNGLNHFYQTCEGARQGTNGYAFVEVPWQQIPGRGQKWYEETLGMLNHDTEKFAQEFECQFMGSSGTLISGAVLKTLKASFPVHKDGAGLTMYEAPVDKHTYTIVCDVSRGKMQDYSAFQVIDITNMPYKQVCVFRSNMVTPLDYSEIIYRTARAYGQATVLVEINDIGGQVADSLHFDFEYENVVYTENAGARGKRISGGFGGSTERGIRTTKTVKAIGCSMLKLLVEQRQLVINDEDTIYELTRFSKKGVSYEAEPGATDDLTMALVLFAWMSDQQYFKELTNIQTLQQLRDFSEEEIEANLVPFGFINENQEDYGDVIDLTVTPLKEFQFF